MELEEWKEKLKQLDDHINSLPAWNDYAVSMQAEYDWLIKQDPRLNEKEIIIDNS